MVVLLQDQKVIMGVLLESSEGCGKTVLWGMTYTLTVL